MRALLIMIMMIATGVCSAYSMEPPDHDALLLIASSATDPCTICAKQNLKKALAILDKDLAPGLEFNADESCMFVKPVSVKACDLYMSCYPTEVLEALKGKGDVLPKIVFTFHTEKSHLVGVAKKDYTNPIIEKLYNDLAPGRVFKACIRLIPYRYGDGHAYNYYRQSNKLQIHCMVVELEPFDKK